MDFIRNFPMFSVVLSLFSGVLCTMLSGKKARIYTILYECVLGAMVIAVLRYTVVTGEAFTYVMGEFPAPWGNELRAGVLEASLAVLFIAVMMTAALMAMTWTNDIFSGYVFLEILTLTSCGVLIVREIGRTTLAAVRYMILNLVGSGLFLLGVVLLYDITGNLLMVPMQQEIAMLYQDPGARVVLIMATGILTIGLSIKSGLFPFHYWMPDTYGWATPTSGAVLSSLVSKCYIFLLIKIYWRVIGIEIFTDMPIRNVLFVLGLCGIVFGSVSAIRAENINRMVAFSSAAQIGYIYMGIGLGGTAGFTAAVFHIMAHAVTKSQLFLTTPRLAAVSGDSLRFKNLQGCALRDPNAGLFFLLPSLSMIGIPIFAGFSSKLFFAMAAADRGGIKLILVMLVLAASSLLNALYFMRTLIRIYTPSDPSNERVRHHLDYNIPMTALTLANLAMGLFSGVFAALIGQGFSMFN